MAKDFYSILGVSRNADAKDIKAAYRKLARRYHPDVNKNDKTAEAKFKEVSEAHDVLSDPEKRKLYDQYGDQWQQVQAGGGVHFQGNPADFSGGAGFSMEDIFRNFFGGGEAEPAARGRSRVRFAHMEAPEARDVEKTIEIPLEEIDRGTRRTLTYQTMDGQQTREGISSVPTTKKVEIDIPAGTPDGGKISVRGKGAAIGSRAGDLYVNIRWASNGRFKPKDGVIEVEVDVPFTVAALGGEIKVPTLRGKTLTMTVPPGTQSGAKFKLAKQGIAKMDGTRTDLVAVAKIVIPKSLTEEQKQLLQQFRQTEQVVKA